MSHGIVIVTVDITHCPLVMILVVGVDSGSGGDSNPSTHHVHCAAVLCYCVWPAPSPCRSRMSFPFPSQRTMAEAQGSSFQGVDGAEAHSTLTSDLLTGRLPYKRQVHFGKQRGFEIDM